MKDGIDRIVEIIGERPFKLQRWNGKRGHSDVGDHWTIWFNYGRYDGRTLDEAIESLRAEANP